MTGAWEGGGNWIGQKSRQQRGGSKGDEKGGRKKWREERGKEADQGPGKKAGQERGKGARSKPACVLRCVDAGVVHRTRGAGRLTSRQNLLRNIRGTQLLFNRLSGPRLSLGANNAFISPNSWLIAFHFFSPVCKRYAVATLLSVKWNLSNCK